MVSIPAPVGFMPAVAAPAVVNGSSVAATLRLAGVALIAVGVALMAAS